MPRPERCLVIREGLDALDGLAVKHTGELAPLIPVPFCCCFMPDSSLANAMILSFNCTAYAFALAKFASCSFTDPLTEFSAEPITSIALITSCPNASAVMLPWEITARKLLSASTCTAIAWAAMARVPVPILEPGVCVVGGWWSLHQTTLYERTVANNISFVSYTEHSNI